MNFTLNQTSALISVEQLQDLQKNPDCILLDASIPPIGTKPDDIVKDTIPGAIFFDIEKQFSDLTSLLPHTLVSPEVFQKEAQALGINQNSVLVVFDRYGIYSAPRAWWMFKIMGHDKVFILNGGLPVWKKTGLPSTQEFTRAQHAGNFIAHLQQQLLMNKNDILDQLNSNQTNSTKLNVVDARSAARFYAQVEEPRAGLRKGHIPGAANIPFADCVEAGQLKSPEKLRELLNLQINKQKINAEQTTAFSCGSGITACVPLLAFYELGFKNLVLYDGSWAEWGADASLPISTTD